MINTSWCSRSYIYLAFMSNIHCHHHLYTHTYYEYTIYMISPGIHMSKQKHPSPVRSKAKNHQRPRVFVAPGSGSDGSQNDVKAWSFHSGRHQVRYENNYETKILLMVQKSGDHQLWLVVYSIIYRVLYISGGCLGFLPSTVAPVSFRGLCCEF